MKFIIMLEFRKFIYLKYINFRYFINKLNSDDRNMEDKI